MMTLYWAVMLKAATLLLMIALAAQRPVEPTWTTLSPPDVGFSIQGPGTAVPSPTRPTTY